MLLFRLGQLRGGAGRPSKIPSEAIWLLTLRRASIRCGFIPQRQEEFGVSMLAQACFSAWDFPSSLDYLKVKVIRYQK
jgi:hypothetical protein